MADAYELGMRNNHCLGDNKDEHMDLNSGSNMEHMHQGSTLSFHDVNYVVESRKYGCCGPQTRKDILIHVNGICRPGMNAILGPTGSGKTSLLNVLAGRKDPNGLTGQILMDGKPIPENFKCMVGYVLQVGNEFIRGISGGERKRTNIGMELVMSPPLLFLDEPTTGLDSSTANAVMVLLTRLALSGKTIIFSIHQPRFSIFKLFDDIILLSRGEVVFQGHARQTLEYFQHMGHECEEHNNPCDFFLDIVNGDITTVHIDRHTDHYSIQIEDSYPEQITNAGDVMNDLQMSLVQSYQKSTLSTTVDTDLKQIYDGYTEWKRLDPDVTGNRVNYSSSVFRQFCVVSGRAGKNIIRNPQTSFVQIVVVAIFAVIVGGIYYQLSDEAAIQNRRGALFFIVMNQIFGNLSAVELFIQDRALFIHENSSGYYRVSSYYLSKLMCDILPLRLVPVILFSSICYWMVGLRPEAESFFIFTFTLFLATMSACGVAFVVSASVRIFAVANLLIAIIYVFMMVFGGLLIQLDTVGDWISWMKWFSIFRYGLEALTIIELKDRSFCGQMNSTPLCDGNEYLKSQGIAYTTDWDLWSRHVALIGITVGCLLLTYIQLLRVKKLK